MPIINRRLSNSYRNHIKDLINSGVPLHYISWGLYTEQYRSDNPGTAKALQKLVANITRLHVRED